MMEKILMKQSDSIIISSFSKTVFDTNSYTESVQLLGTLNVNI